MSADDKLIAGRYSFHSNCMDWLRLFAALSIVFDHSIRWFQLRDDFIYQILSHILVFPGLMILFCMSGFLISASWERCYGWKDYLWKRFSRLYPGLWVAFVFSAIVVLIMTNRYGISVSLFNWLKWIFAQLTVFQFYTPPDLKQYGIGNPNGVLWTIPIEICMYLFIMLFYGNMKKWRMWGWCLMLVLAVLLNIICQILCGCLPSLVGKIIFVSPLPYMYMFGIGMFVYNFRDYIVPLLCHNFWFIFIAYLVWIAFNRYVFHFNLGLYIDIFTGVGICFLVMAIAYKFGERKLKNDYSYSIYLYHEIFINIIVIAGLSGFAQTWIAVGVVYICTLICAYISCHVIEMPATRYLKNRAQMWR